MSKIRAFRRKGVLVAAMAAASAVTAGWTQRAPAAAVTWNGGGLDDFWTTPLNWNGGVAPSAGDSLIFDGFARLATNNDNFPAATQFAGITFAPSAGAFTLAGNQIDLTGNLVDNTAVLTQIVNNNLIVGATRDVNVASNTGTLRLGGIVSGAGGLHKLGGGTLVLGAANTFTGSIDIGAGRVQISADNNLGAAPVAATPNNLIIDGIGGVLQTTANMTLNANRGIGLGPAGGAGTGVIDVNSGTTLTYNGIMANNTGGTGGLVKTSFGTLVLGGGNTYSGSTQIKNGAVTLNFANAGAPTSNIINPASSLVIGGATSGLGQQSNATLNITGRANTAVSQTFASTNVDLYGSVIQLTNGTGTATTTLNLGAITRTLGGTLVIPTSTGSTVNTTTSVAGTNGILGGWAVAGTANVQRGITLGTDWATVDGTGKIVPYTAYTNVVDYTGPAPTDPPSAGDLAQASLLRNQAGVGPSANVKYTGTAASLEVRVDQPNANRTTDINTFAFTTNGVNNTLSIGSGNTLRLGVQGGIYKQSTANNQMYIGGAGVVSGNGSNPNVGKLTAGGPNDNTAGEIVLTLNETANNNGGLNVLASIVDNGTGPVTLIKTGVASVKIDGHNTYTGGTFINQGRFQLAGSEANAPNPDGLGSGPVTVAPGGYLFVSGVNSATIPFAGNGAIPGARLNSAQNAPMPNNMFLSGNGTSQEAGGSIRLGGRAILSGQMTLVGDTRWFGGNGLVYMSANADGTNPTGSTYYLDPGNEFSGKITGPGSIDFGGRAVSGFNGVISSPLNDYSGQSTILPTNGSALLRLGGNEVIPHGVGKGNLNFGDGPNTAILDMQGFSETVNGLSTAASTNLAGAFVQNNGFNAVVTGDGQARTWTFTPKNSVLTVGGFDASATFGGVIRDRDTGAGPVTFPNPIYDGDATPTDPATNVDVDGDAPTVSITAPWNTAGSTIALTKIGSGIQVLTGQNSYTGPTNVTGGVLAVNGTLALSSPVTVSGAGSAIAGAVNGANSGTVGAITVNSGGAVSPGAAGVGTIGTLNATSLSMDNGKLLIDFGSPNSDQLNLTGAAAFTGANVIQPSGSGVSGTYTILNAPGGITGAGTLTVGSFPFIPDSRPASATVVPSANKIDVVVTGAKNLTWTGNVNSNWELGAGGSLNWNDGDIAERFFNADTTRFGDGPTNRNVNLGVNVLPGAVVFANNGTNDYVVSGTGSIGGLNGILMGGTGHATVATNNNFTGQIHASNGKLTMSGSNTPGSVLVDGGILEVAGNMSSGTTSVVAGELHIGNGGTSGNLTGPITDNALMKFRRTDNFTFAGSISGSGRVEQVGGGTVTVTANNSYTGATNITNGIINVTSFAGIGGPTADVNIPQGGTLDLAGIPTANLANGFGTGKNFRISGTGATGVGAAITNSGTLAQQNAFQRLIVDQDATIGGAGRFDLRGGTGGPSLQLNGHTLTKIGAGQFSIVAGTIDFGNIVVNGGVLGIETTTTNLDGGSITMNSGTTLQFFQFNQTNGDGIAMPITMNGATLSDANQTHATTITVPVTVNASNTFNIQNSTGFTFSGDIGGTGGMTKAGNGLAVLTGLNNNIGGVLGASAGRIRLDSNLLGSSGLSVSGTGVIELSTDGSHNKFIKTGAITVAGTGKADIKDNKLFSSDIPGTTTGGIYNGVQGAVQSAYDFGAWDGPGLTTSMPAAVAGLTTIGVATGNQIRGLGPTDTDTFAGQTITGATVVAMYTYAGDANLDGTIDGGDYGIIDNFAQIPGADGYANGDFNYDGVIDGGDYGIIDNNIQAQGAPFPTSGAVASAAGGSLAGVTAVPEPASLSVLGLAAAGLFGRRRRRRVQ